MYADNNEDKPGSTFRGGTFEGLSCGSLTAICWLADADVATAASRHACRYFDVEVMRLVCGSFSRKGDAPDHRGVDYAEQYFPWWCKGLRSA